PKPGVATLALCLSEDAVAARAIARLPRLRLLPPRRLSLLQICPLQQPPHDSRSRSTAAGLRARHHRDPWRQ
ncbi:hypothetical protein ACJRO7_004718, partial [Eucalyptus globulus]